MTKFYLGTESSSDIITTESLSRLWLYGQTQPSIQYGLYIDWDNSGTFETTDNEAAYMKDKLTIDRGRQTIIAGPGQGFEPYVVGKMRVIMDNSTGRYNPWDTDGPLYTLINPGKFMQLACSFPADLAESSRTSEILFTGQIADIIYRGHNNEVILVCEDAFGILDRQVLNQKATLVISDNIEAYVATVLNFAQYPYASDIKASTDSSTDDKYPIYLWLDDESALHALENLAAANLASMSALADGTFWYRTPWHSDCDIKTLTDTMVLKDIATRRPWDARRDKIELHVTKTTAYKAVDIHFVDTDESPWEITPTRDFYIWSAYEYDSKRLVGGISDTGNQPTVDLVYTHADENDSDAVEVSSTAQMVFSWTDYLHGVQFQLSSFSTDTYYIHKISCRGSNENPFIELEPMVLSYGSTNDAWYINKFVMPESQFLTIHYESVGVDNALVYAYAWRNRRRIDDIGYTLYKYLSTDIQHPIIKLRGRYFDQFEVDVERKIRYISTTQDIDGYFRICGISHESIHNLQDIETTLFLYPVITPEEYPK